MTQPSLRPRRSALLAALCAAAALVLLSACSSGGGDGGGGGTQRSGLRLIIDSGSDLRGIEVVMNHDPALVVIGVEPAGIFIGDTCESNVGSNFLNLLCVQGAGDTFDAPAPAWALTVEYPGGTSPADYVLSLTCEASDEIGNTFEVACSLS